MGVLTAVGQVVPPPSYLLLPGAGVDIGAGSVKTVTFKSHIGTCVLDTFAETPLKEGVVVNGDIEMPDVLVDVLRTVRLRERIQVAHTALPERKAYLYQALIPHEAVHDLADAIESTLESHVPIAPTDVIFDYEVVRTVSAGVVVSVTAFARRVVESYADVFARAGITLRSLEIESQALGRALWGAEDRTGTVMAIDVGRHITRVGIFDHGVVGFTATLDVGGDTFTSALMKRFTISEEEAEKRKNEQGFLEGSENREVFEALATTASVLRDEVSRHLMYWNTPSDETDAVPRQPIQGIVLVGGNANVKGLPEYLARGVNLPVSVGNVWKNVMNLDENIPSMPFNRSLEFATTIGLAARSCNPRIW